MTIISKSRLTGSLWLWFRTLSIVRNGPHCRLELPNGHSEVSITAIAPKLLGHGVEVAMEAPAQCPHLHRSLKGSSEQSEVNAAMMSWGLRIQANLGLDHILSPGGA